MLPPAMRRAAILALCLLTVLSVASVLAACGSDEDTAEAAEGEPIEVAGLDYNVQLTRFLNPDDPEDAEYLVGQPPPPRGTYYLGVFLVIGNPTDAPLPSATGYTIRDTLLNEYDAVDSRSPYALDIGQEVPANGGLPLADTTAATGPNHGSLLIFPVSADVSENRPLRLEITTDAGSADVILDI
jgi:hypothetical protein